VFRFDAAMRQNDAASSNVSVMYRDNTFTFYPSVLSYARLLLSACATLWFSLLTVYDSLRLGLGLVLHARLSPLERNPLLGSGAQN